MGHTILVDFETFASDILGVKPSLCAVEALPDKVVNGARLVFDQLFHEGATPTEAVIAEHFIKVVNMENFGSPLSKHKAAFTGNHTTSVEGEEVGGEECKIDAGLYLNEHFPVNARSTTGKLTSGKPEWNHIRLFIVFKRKGTNFDPFDDYEPDAPDSEYSAQTRQAVRRQITDYVLDIRNRQHRTCIYGLFIIGPEFRVMRFDQHGTIVTKKKDYAEDPRALLSFLAWFDRVLPEQQGYDPTATLLTEGSRAYKLMEEFSEDHVSDMPLTEGSRVPATYMPPPRDVQGIAVEPATLPCDTREKTKATPSTDDESYLDEVEVDNAEDPRVFAYVRKKFRQSLEKGWPRYRLEVGDEKRLFLVGKPIWTASWLFGRGTRGYIALDVKKRRFVFLKDCWRPYYEATKSEGEWLEILNRAGTNATKINVPTLVTHGDVAGQVTKTAQYANHCAAQARRQNKTSRQDAEIPLSPAYSGTKEDYIDPSVSTSAATTAGNADGPSSQHDSEVIYRRPYTHYRIVTKDVCLPFTEITSSSQLVVLLFDCVVAHSYAYTDHRLLHRDISAGNVIIRPSLSSKVTEDGYKKVVWKGILTDWELAKVIPAQDPSDSEKPIEEVPPRLERTGTWQFMSVAYVRNQFQRPVTVADELESFFHVFLYYALRLLHHNVSNVPFFVWEYFDSCLPGGKDKKYCSTRKSAAMDVGKIWTAGGLPLHFTFPNGAAHQDLNDMISTLLYYFHARYQVLSWEYQQSLVRSNPAAPGDPSNAPAGPSRSQSRFSERLERRRKSAKFENIELRVFKDESEPFDQIKARAEDLDDHSAFVTILWDALYPNEETPARTPVWPVTDVVRDRLPDTYDPGELASKFNKMYTASGKRTADADPDGAPARKKLRTDISEPSGHSLPFQPTRARTVGRCVGTLPGDS
ncbi:hypothetical protein PYCCODRAFT_1399542 [Trametes coccinea BRFM310]|uniref:Fungal-type protein kinase domain-containing protein n=1 Tax=Trametes coccinea (strain BRFM310) TaxID=1353009 RepID=A0A1Y2I785_TRAC3|nr:hypothetical protein PYCCODRAFT_1399542 [Trametes coccinea BRFM310]